MKKKLILTSSIIILLLLIPIYNSYSEKKELNLKSEQLEKDFINEFYINAKLEYAVYKKIVDSYPNIEVIKSDDILDQINRNNMKKIINDSENLKNEFNISIDPRLDRIKEYYSIWFQAHGIYLSQVYLKDKSRPFDFSDKNKKTLEKYLNIVDDIIKDYKLDPINN